jgi:enolase-phosphatase E1
VTEKPAAILLDIEGTTSSISFVADILFPYARRHLPSFIAAHGTAPTVKQALADTQTLAGTDADAVATLLQWIDDDVKAPPLKLLQGLIWAKGYENGELKGHIYDDALDALRSWKHTGIPLYIYSSGSVQAQVQLFQHNIGGDLRSLFSGHFDLTTGPKVEAESYRKIAAAIGKAPGAILFLSDNPKELEAAQTAGVRVFQVVREKTLPDNRFPIVHSFAEIAFG